MRSVPSLLGILCLSLVACDRGGDDPPKKPVDEAKKADETKAEPDKKDEGEASLKVAAGDPPVDGPVPPETSMVVFSIEGALNPLGCFDKDKGQMLGAEACLDLVPEGAEVRLSSIDSEYNKIAGPRVEPQCLIGSGKTVAIEVEGITEGAQFVYGTFPRSAMKTVRFVEDKTLDARRIRLSDEEKQKLSAAAGGGLTPETIEPHQVAEVDVYGDGSKDKVYSVFAPDPRVSEQYRWSGVFLAKGGSLGALTLLDKSTTKRDVFEVRGTVDLDGDGKKELWMRLVFEEGAGDRIVALDGKSAKPLGGWSCGAGR
jgi:hypothetical protein